MTFPSYPTLTRQLPPRQLASFPAAGPLGWITSAWLWWLKRYLNRDRYRLTLKGRAAKRPELRGYGGSIKLRNARKWGLYIDDKMESKLNEYSRAVGRHDERRHLKEERKAGDELERLLTNERNLVKAHETAQAHLMDKVASTRRKVETLRDQLAAGELVRHRDHKSNAAIDRIWSELNGSEWNGDTLERIAAHVAALGYKIGDPGEPAAAMKGGQ